MAAWLMFDLPEGWLLVIPLLLVLLFAAGTQRKRGLSYKRIALLMIFRGLAVIFLVFLLSRPMLTSKEPPAPAARSVALLFDRSESMSLQEHDRTRFEQALDFAKRRLLPALNSAKLPVHARLFDGTTEPADAEKLERTTPSGKRTNLGVAIGDALGGSSEPPLAVIALTDGDANESAENARALTRLVGARVPFIGVGFGSDHGVQTLSLRNIEAPSVVGSKTSFSVGAQLETMNAEDTPPFDLLLFRDGQMVQKKNVIPGTGSRTWLENFQVIEDKEGAHTYAVQVLPPNQQNLKCLGLMANTSVRISDEKELRVLYIQGALTWDYKFIGLALHDDPAIKMTGLTRTSQQAVFRQNVESAGEFLNGFPTSLDELAPFRVVVLSNLRPADLSTQQQQILARFVGEMGGGLLMIGGAGTFDSSWQSSRLEQLLPVVFAANAGVQGFDRPFKVQLTEDALQSPLFQLLDKGSVRESWAQIPTFTEYARVDAIKPGAQLWMRHPADEGPQGPRVLMASQRYGAGLSAVLTIQNFWRWRLAKDGEPAQFDRFWKQLFRYLSDAGRQDIAIQLADQELHPQMDVKINLEKQPNPKNLSDKNTRYVVHVENSRKQLLHEEAVELEALRPVEVHFRAEKPDVYHVSVSDSLNVPLASRSIEIRDINVEFQNTARNMETLRQWASVSDGLAFKVEDCPDAADLVAQIKNKIEEVRRGKATRRPFGVNGWSMITILGLLSAEYSMRKRWGLT